MQKILIVEDNAGNSKLYKDVLGSTSEYEVTQLSDASDIISILSKINPNLVIMDIMLNGMSGLDAMQIINKDGRFKKIPFLAISGHQARDYKDKAIAAGFNKYMEKPIFIDVFLETIKSMMNR